MDTTEKLKELVVKKYEELQTYSTNYNARAKDQRERLISENKEAFMNNPSSVNVNEIAKEMFYLNGFFQADIRRLQTQLVDIHSFVKEVDSSIEFPKEVESTVTILKNSLPGLIFVVEDGEFKEIEKGKVDTLTQDFEQKGYYKLFEDQVKKLLNA